jgi:beta-glucosidase
VHKLIRNGVDVQRYYHWSLLDNFEWAEGLRPRFGLYKVNYKTLERTITRSGEMYQEICENNAITDEIILKYLS